MTPVTAAYKGYRPATVQVLDSAARRDGWRIQALDGRVLTSHRSLYEACRWVRDLGRVTGA